MTDTSPEPTPAEDTEPTPDDVNQAAIPKNRTEADGAIGYAVWDVQLQRFVSGVTPDKPSSSEAKKLAPGGHAIVRV
jgi:hypothetical protein